MSGPDRETDASAAPSGGRPLIFGFAVGGLSAVAFLTAGIVRLVGSVAVPVISITALLLLAATPLLRRLARWAGTPRPDHAAAWSLLGVLPLLILGAQYALGDEPILSSHWRCGTGDIGLAILSPLPFALFGGLGGLLGFILSAARERRHVYAGIRILSRAALLLGALFASAAALRALHAPSTDNAQRYLDALPTVAALPPLVTTEARTAPPTPTPLEPAPELVDETSFGDLIARRSCVDSICSIALRRKDGRPPPDQKWASERRFPASEPVRIQRDEKHGFWIIGRSAAFRDTDFQVTDITVKDLGDELSAPPGWILGGAAGVLVALALWQKRRHLARRLSTIEAAQSGVLGDNGWITFDDDTAALRAPPDLALSPGPVLLVRRSAAGGAAGAYRSEGPLGRDEMVAGARGDLVSNLRDRLAGLDALGITAVLLTSAPLVAAWASGLLLSWG